MGIGGYYSASVRFLSKKKQKDQHEKSIIDVQIGRAKRAMKKAPRARVAMCKNREEHEADVGEIEFGLSSDQWSMSKRPEQETSRYLSFLYEDER